MKWSGIQEIPGFGHDLNPGPRLLAHAERTESNLLRTSLKFDLFRARRVFFRQINLFPLAASN
jgi:hypothetical protein